MGLVEFEIFVFCDDGDFPADRLPDDEPVEGIAMADPWKLMKCRDVLCVDPQDLQIHRFRDGVKLRRRNVLQVQFAREYFSEISQKETRLIRIACSRFVMGAFALTLILSGSKTVQKKVYVSRRYFIGTEIPPRLS